jgi:hypothetical protein
MGKAGIDSGGEGGIRTPDSLATMSDFESDFGSFAVRRRALQNIVYLLIIHRLARDAPFAVFCREMHKSRKPTATRTATGINPFWRSFTV